MAQLETASKYTAACARLRKLHRARKILCAPNGFFSVDCGVPTPWTRRGRYSAEGKAKPKPKAKSKSGAKSKGGQALGRCGNCDAEGAVKKCMQCGTKA
jgi:hypothetical protein